MYLENIFSAEDIQKQLPGETTKFKQVDRFWKELFRKIKSKAWCNAMDAMNMPGLLDQLRWANDTLDQVQKSLEAYLETKRQAFPRFYFLSNDELLSILSQTRGLRREGKGSKIVGGEMGTKWDSRGGVKMGTSLQLDAIFAL